MPLFQTLVNGLRSWRRRLRGPKARSRAGITMEQLDHRRLLAVNFTGNAVADIPSTLGPGFAIVNDGTDVPIRNPQLRDLIKVSGFDIDAIRMFYDPTIDTLSVAFQQPLNQKTDPQYPVIAGDADNNLNGGTVDPAVRLVQPLFMDFPNLGGSETMAMFLDFNNDGTPDVVAGVPNTPGAGKNFTVSQAAVTDPTAAPAFGAPLLRYTGAMHLDDTNPAAGAFEFQVTNFSELYQQETGQPLTASSIVSVGGFAGSNDDFIDEEYVPAQAVSFGNVPPPPPPEQCPPLSPPVAINPHEHYHVNTAHPDYVRVTIFGTSGFDVTHIQPGSVQLGGASPLGHFVRRANKDGFPDATYVFRGSDITLPEGITQAHVTGLYNDTTTGKQVAFDTARTIFNRTSADYSASARASQAVRIARRGVPGFPAPFVERRATLTGVDLVIDQLNTEATQAWNGAGRPTVSIPTAQAIRAQRLSGHPVTIHRRSRAADPTPATSSAAISAPTITLTPTQSRAVSRMDNAGYLTDVATSLAS